MRSIFFIFLVQARVDVNETSPSGNTPLHAAVNTGNVSMVKLLISAGAKLDAWNPECEGATPLHLAIMSGKCLVFEMQQIETLRPHFSTSHTLCWL